ncbi:MAG TPA: HAMP domain-containing sensor histidine kinase, partial [Propionicimonas sp.]|nr:HAMP domain-containing sensor histidine kinase [Propionicimonas sp.]
ASARRLAAWSIRARVIAGVVALTGVALALSGLIVTSRGHALTEQRVADDLQLVIEEFNTLAETGVSPETGEPFTDAKSLLKSAVQRSVLATNEGALGVVDGKLAWAAQDNVPLRLEDDAEFTAAVLPLTNLGTVSQGRLVTAQRDYRYLVVPVRFANGTPGGALVRAVDFGAEESLLAEIWRSYILVALGSLLLVGLLIWILVGRLLEPLTWMRRTAEQVTDTDLSQRIPVRGADDLSALGVTMNNMLDRLEGAVGAQRELLDDVGHELRTPLTIIRGHLELMDADNPEDVATTKELLLDETDRMRRLVDDLLALARAERPELLRPELTDVARLTDETLAKASGLGQRHWVLDELADVELVLDPQRVAQAWLQLAANAVRYSAEGSTVGMGSQVRRGDLRLWVRDEGVGIGPEDQARVTQRFERGIGGGGTGLGLAIVNAIARAHSGRMEIMSEPGVGSTISIVIPVRQETK